MAKGPVLIHGAIRLAKMIDFTVVETLKLRPAIVLRLCQGQKFDLSVETLQNPSKNLRKKES